MGVSNYCDSEGHLVGPEGTMGGDPSEFYAIGLASVVGCSHLRCVRCRAEVRSELGIVPRDPDVAPRDIYAVPDWRGSHLTRVESRPRHRFYCCNCTLRSESVDRPLVNADPGPSTRDLPWRCAGHPPVAPPFELDGVPVAEDTDLVDLVWKVFVEGAPQSAREHERAGARWVQKLYVRCRGTGLGRRVAGAVADLLTDEDPQVRGLALVFFSIFPSAPGAARVGELAVAQPELFGSDQSPEHPTWTLADRLRDCLGQRIQVVDRSGQITDLGALEAARRAILESSAETSLLRGLIKIDGAWVVEHAGQVARSHRPGWQRVLDGFRTVQPNRLGCVTTRLLKAGSVEPRKVRQWALANLHGFARKQVLDALGA